MSQSGPPVAVKSAIGVKHNGTRKILQFTFRDFEVDFINYKVTRRICPRFLIYGTARDLVNKKSLIFSAPKFPGAIRKRPITTY